MGHSVTDHASVLSLLIRISHRHWRAPVWDEKAHGSDPDKRRLMVAQDTGSAIKGAQRADIFFGTGDEAGQAAGRLKDPGRMVLLLPIQRAYALLPDEF